MAACLNQSVDREVYHAPSLGPAGTDLAVCWFNDMFAIVESSQGPMLSSLQSKLFLFRQNMTTTEWKQVLEQQMKHTDRCAAPPLDRMKGGDNLQSLDGRMLSSFER